MDNKHVISEIGAPTILNLYWMAYKVSTLNFIATNFVPNTDVSLVNYFLEYQVTSDFI